MLFILNCKPINKNITNQEEVIINIELDTNCVKLLHPQWIDEVTGHDEDGSLRGRYNGLKLKSYLKNICSDTIQIETSNLDLNVGLIKWYLKNSVVLSEIGDVYPIATLNVLPSDSIFLNLSEFNAFKINELDSVSIWVNYIKNNERNSQLLNIDLSDIIFPKK